MLCDQNIKPTRGKWIVGQAILASGLGYFASSPALPTEACIAS
jgi:hypothetical protein